MAGSRGRWVLGFVFFSLLLLSCEDSPHRKLNLVHISIDTLVPERMSLYGNPRETTPRIDALARQGVTFVNAFSTAPWTLPAHASMLSGRYPLSLSNISHDERLFSLTPMLSERFRESGYATGALTASGFCSAEYGFDRGFDDFVEVFKSGNAVREIAWSIDWITAHRDEPFFYFFHTFAAHEPYLDRRYVESGQGGRLAEIYTPQNARKLQLQVCCTEMEVTERERDFMLALYDGGVSAADEIVGELLDALSELDLLDHTVVIVTSDHGQEFWAHTGRGGHGHSLYQELLRIPLVWYEPQMESAGAVRSEQVTLVDLVPTLVERFGLDTEDEFDGVDITPLLEGKSWSLQRSLYAEAIHHGPERFSVWNDEAKVILTPDPSRQLDIGREHPVAVAAPIEVFLGDDREERNNVYTGAGAPPVGLGELEEALAAHRAAAPSVGSEYSAPEPEPALLEQLRALGYAP